jgi:hypothetical protein
VTSVISNCSVNATTPLSNVCQGRGVWEKQDVNREIESKGSTDDPHSKNTTMKIRTENVLDVSEWDALVEKTYGRPYSFQQQDGCKSRGVFRFTVPDEAEDYERDSVPEIVNGDEMGVSFAAWLARDPKQKLPGRDEQEDYCLRLWWERNFYPDVQMVANDLHARGLFEAGDYTIDIDW